MVRLPCLRFCKECCCYVVALLLKRIFCFSRNRIQQWLLTKTGSGRPSAVPLHCCMRIFRGWICMTLSLSPVFSHLNFILAAEVPTIELTCPSLFSRVVTVAWSGPLLLRLKTHDRRTLCIDLPTSIPIPVGQRMTLNNFLRNHENTVILALVCTQSGQIEQLTGPNKYGRLGALADKCVV